MDAISKFLNQYRVKPFSRGEIILVEGEVPATAYVVKKGVVKTYNLTGEGQEKPLSFDIENEAFPVGWVFAKSPRTQHFHEAFTDCELFCIPRDEYVSFLRRTPEAMYQIFESVLKGYLNSQMRINALEQSKASDKVIHTLHFLCLRFGKDMKHNVVQIQLPLTQQDLANFMGLTRETTGIELKKLEKAGVLTYRKQKYTVQTNRLNDLLDDEYDDARIIEEVV